MRGGSGTEDPQRCHTFRYDTSYDGYVVFVSEIWDHLSIVFSWYLTLYGFPSHIARYMYTKPSLASPGPVSRIKAQWIPAELSGTAPLCSSSRSRFRPAFHTRYHSPDIFALATPF